MRHLRNRQNHLLCMVDDRTGQVSTEGPHKSEYSYVLPVGASFTVKRGNLISTITRTRERFIVADSLVA